MKNELMKYGKETSVKYLEHFFNDCYSKETSPDCWRKGVITSLYKKGAKDDPGNYRPITLLSPTGKLYASIINMKLVNYLESNNLIDTAQNGFRMVDSRNTDDHLVSLHEIYNYADKNKSPVFSAFIDFSKAFDSVPRNAMLAALKDTGIPKRLYKAIESMYNNTKAQCIANGTKSREFSIHRGVAQGCPLSPTIFAVYINSLIKEINASGIGIDLQDGKQPVGILAYADDIVLLAEDNKALQEMANITHKWCKKWGMKANIKKCGILAIQNKEKPTLEWGDSSFPIVDSYKYLGVTFEPNMKFDKHTKKIHDAAKGKLKKLAHVLGSTYIGPDLKKRIYEENVRSKMEYGSIAWGELKSAKKLGGIQKQSIQTIMNIDDVWAKAAEGELGMLSLEERRQLTMMKYFFKVNNMQDDRLPKRILSRKWPAKSKQHSTMAKMTSLKRRWKIEASTGIEEGESESSAKNKWKTTLEKHLDKYRQERNRSDRQPENEFYRGIIPSLKRTKDYLTKNNAASKAKFEAITSKRRKDCPLCQSNDVILARHIIADCGYLFKQRSNLAAKMKLPKKRYCKVILNTVINESTGTNPQLQDFATTTAHVTQYANDQLKVANCQADDLVGKIVDIRQNEEWYRCRITHNRDGNLTIDSDGLDEWPFDYFELRLENFRDTTIKIHGKMPIILRNHNCLSFTNLDANQGKTIFIKGKSHRLIKSLKNGAYVTDRGKIKLKNIIKRGMLNSCFINGDVAKRHASANRREPNASRQGNP